MGLWDVEGWNFVEGWIDFSLMQVMMDGKSKSEILEKLRLATGQYPFDTPDELKGVLSELDDFAGMEALDPQLRHFLKRRSYTKAIEYLEAGT